MQTNAPIDAINWFRVKIAGTENTSVKKSQLQAVEALRMCSECVNITFDDINENLLNEWVSWMSCKRYSIATVKTYTSRLSALYGKAVKEGIAENHPWFSNISKRLRDVAAESIEINSISDCFGKLRRLVLKDCAKNSSRQLAKDIVLFSLYNGGLSFEELAKFKKGDYHGNDETIIDIIYRYSKPRNKYLFPLMQSERTPRQLHQAISTLFSEALTSVNINLSSYTSATSIDLWAQLAVCCGISAADIAGCIGFTDHINPIFSFSTPSEISFETKAEIISRVNRILAKDPEEWHAMQFRPHVNHIDILTRLQTIGISFPKSFYPFETIVRRIGKQLVRESKPVVPGLFFFKCKSSDLSGLFYQIGDLAWGYRYSHNPGSSYAVIPEKAIKDYERAVGQFIEGIDEYPDGNFKIEKGDKFKIIGGEFDGYPATFEKEIREIEKGSQTLTRITYRLKLASSGNFAWVVELDSRCMTKISEEKFEELREKFRSN